MAGARVSQRGTDGFSIQVDLPERTVIDGRVERKCCNGECTGVGKWRLVTRDYLCEACRKCPEHKLICRSTAKKKFGLTYEQLHAAHKSNAIRMFSVTNPHNSKSPPMRLYYEREIADLAKRLRPSDTNYSEEKTSRMRVEIPRSDTSRGSTFVLSKKEYTQK